MSYNPPAQLLTGRDILLVEDEPLILMMLEDMLRDFGARDIESASHTQGALEVLSVSSVDLAVLDVHLSRDTSYELARQLVNAGTPILFVTGSGLDELPGEFRDIPLLAKPFTEAELRGAVARLVHAPEACPAA